MDKRILELGQQIDNLDEEIIQLLKKRMGISKEVGKLKEELDIPVEDKTAKTKLLTVLLNKQVKIYPKNSLYGFLLLSLNPLSKSSVESSPFHRFAILKKTPVGGILDQFFIFAG